MKKKYVLVSRKMQKV